ncbi:MAG: hypothetical protein H6702_00775 [Myxococcales bacterium]|nr:hypothetical protein [Myxococcales bacterium]
MRTLLPTLLLAALAGCTPSLDPPPLDPPAPRRSGEARLAGDHAASALVHNLAQTFAARVPGPALVVEAPLGAQGARQAVADGLLGGAITLVPLGTAGGIPIARTQPVLVAGPGVRTRRVAAAQLAETLQGRRPTWVDGLPRRILLRDPDDPLEQAIGRADPLLAAAFDEAHRSRRWRVFSDEEALLGAVRRTPGALTVSDTGSLALQALPVWVIRGVDAPPLEIRLELGPNPSPRLQAFAAFVVGPVGRGIIADLGYSLPAGPP